MPTDSNPKTRSFTAGFFMLATDYHPCTHHTSLFRCMAPAWPLALTEPTKVAGKLRRAVRSSRFAGILGGRHMECAYYFDFCRLYPPLLAPIKSCPLSLLALQKGEGWRSRGEGSSSVHPLVTTPFHQAH